MAEVFDYLNGKGGLYVFGLIVLIIFLVRKIKAEMYFKSVHKKEKNKKK